MSETAIATREQVEKIVPAAQSQARGIVVTNSEDYEYACSWLQMIKRRMGDVSSVFDPIVKKAHEAHKEAVSQKNKFMNPLLEAEVAVKGKVSKWLADQEAARRIEERRLAADAQKEADDRATAQAAELRKQGEHELADMVVEEQATAPAAVVVLPTDVPKAQGISQKTNWKWRYAVSEGMALREIVKAAAADDRLLVLLQVNESELNSQATRHKDLARIPGVEVFSEKTVAVRGA